MVNDEKKLDGLIDQIYNLENFDGETMQYIIEKLCMREQMLRQLIMSSNMSEVYALFLEKNDGRDGVPHRMAMILDDLNIIRNFIKETHGELLDTQTSHADNLNTHFNNIEIACDLNDDEPLNWKPFGSSEESREGLKYFWQDVINDKE